MILHSIVSPADIFFTADVPKPEYRQIKGGIVELSGGTVKRLISTDPRLYLDKRYAPYTKFGKQTP